MNLRKDHYPIGMITRAYAQVVVLVPQSHYRIWCIAFFIAWRFQLCVCIRVVVSATNPSSAHQNLVGYLKHIKRSLNVKV